MKEEHCGCFPAVPSVTLLFSVFVPYLYPDFNPPFTSPDPYCTMGGHETDCRPPFSH